MNFHKSFTSPFSYTPPPSPPQKKIFFGNFHQSFNSLFPSTLTPPPDPTPHPTPLPQIFFLNFHKSFTSPFTFTLTPPHPDPPPPPPPPPQKKKKNIFFFEYSQKLLFSVHIHPDPTTPPPPQTRPPPPPPSKKKKMNFHKSFTSPFSYTHATSPLTVSLFFSISLFVHMTLQICSCDISAILNPVINCTLLIWLPYAEASVGGIMFYKHHSS